MYARRQPDVRVKQPAKRSSDGSFQPPKVHTNNRTGEDQGVSEQSDPGLRLADYAEERGYADGE